MRPLPNVLTIDVLSALKNPDGTITDSEQELFRRREELAEIGKALNFRDINYVTLKAMHPEDILIGCIIAKVMHHVKILYPKEAGRGPLVFKHAHEIYERVISTFRQMTEKDGNLDKKLNSECDTVNHYIERMYNAERDRTWSREAFEKRYPTSDKSTFKGQANDVYANVMDNRFPGDATDYRYEPSQGWDAGRVTKEWMHHSVRFEHFSKIADELIDKEINSIPSAKKISLRNVDEREGVIFVGANGSGKSWMFEAFVTALMMKDVDPYDMAYHNTDFGVNAVWQFANLDSSIKPYLKDEHKGIQTHGAASDWAYKQLLLRIAQADDGMAPNVAAGSVEINNDIIDEILRGGGKVQIHHISVSKEVAKESCKDRKDVSGRVPDAAVVDRSVKNASNSLTRVTEASYRGSHVTTYVYERCEVNQAPQLAAIIDCEKSEVLICDMEAFIRALGRSERVNGVDDNDTVKKSAKVMMKEMLGNKFSLVSVDRKGEELYRLDPDGMLSHKEGQQESLNDIIMSLNKSGQGKYTSKFADRHGILSAGVINARS